jgi:AcrR family transcriptional regulator
MSLHVPVPAQMRGEEVSAARSPGPAERAQARAGTRSEARATRESAQAAGRRAHVLAAAREAFVELGLERASLREIARRAGYTPGALYSYFDSKEAVYAALLGESLERLNAGVAAAVQAAGSVTPADDAVALRSAARAFFDFYLAHPRDLDLGFYLFQGLQPRGLTPALDQALNRRLRDALAPVQAALERLGLPPADALAETTALFAHAVGLLLLGHTGRIRLFGQQPPALFDRHLDQLLARLPAPPSVQAGQTR